MCSCSTIRKTSDTAAVMNTVMTTPTVTDLEVSKTRVSKTVTWEFDLFRGAEVERRKANVTAELVNENNADILVEPEYIVKTTTLNLGGGSITVSGYPAKFMGFRTATPEDLEALKAVCPLRPDCKKENKEPKRKRFLIF